MGIVSVTQAPTVVLTGEALLPVAAARGRRPARRVLASRGSWQQTLGRGSGASGGGRGARAAPRPCRAPARRPPAAAGPATPRGEGTARSTPARRPPHPR